MSLYFDRVKANIDIDRAAGAARVRYITEVPGQQIVYYVKLQEATAYLAAIEANPTTAVPGAHIAAQAARTGKTALAVAQTVIDTGLLWLGDKSPEIEAERMAGKEAVDAASSTESVEAARDAAVAVLNAL